MNPIHKLTFNYLSKQWFAPKLEGEMAVLYPLKNVVSMDELSDFLKNNLNYLIFSLLPNFRT